MAKGNIQKGTESPVKQRAAKQRGGVAKSSETAVAPAKALNSLAPIVTAKPIIGSAAAPGQTLTRVPAAKPGRAQAKKPKSIAVEGSVTAAAAQRPKPTAQPESLRSLKQAVVVEAPVLLDVAKIKVTFVFPICECCAKSVFLSGDFNDWSLNATPMRRYDDGHWEKTLELAPGRYEYKFVRDGEWMPDLLARENVLNAYGTLNSVMEVRAP